MEGSSLDDLLNSASFVSARLIPILLVVLLIVAILFVRKMQATLVKVDSLVDEGEKTMEAAKRQIDALDAPLKTIESVSETVDLVHDASKNAIRSTVGIISDNIGGIIDKFSKDKSDEVVAKVDDGKDDLNE